MESRNTTGHFKCGIGGTREVQKPGGLRWKYCTKHQEEGVQMDTHG